jgi:hypothetical protein
MWQGLPLQKSAICAFTQPGLSLQRLIPIGAYYQAPIAGWHTMSQRSLPNRHLCTTR